MNTLPRNGDKFTLINRDRQMIEVTVVYAEAVSNEPLSGYIGVVAFKHKNKYNNTHLLGTSVELAEDGTLIFWHDRGDVEPEMWFITTQ
jgi:hypothetical protein